MPLDWNAPLQTKEGTEGILMEPGSWQQRTGDTRRRVLIDVGGAWPTVFLYREDGTCRADGSASPMDLINRPDALAKAA